MSQRQEAHINPRLLIWARTSGGFDDIAAAAEKLNVSREQLVAWESGVSRPTMVQLRRASEVYRRPLAAFFLSDPPQDFHVPHDYRRCTGALPRKMSPALRSEIQRISYLRSAAIEIAEEIDEIPRPNLVATVPTDEPELLAANVRKMLHVPFEVQCHNWKNSTEALKEWRAAVEALGILIFQVEGVDVDEMSGLSIPESPLPIIAINAKDSTNRRIFTLFHEFGHLLLGRDALCDLEEGLDSSSRENQIEVFCNAFAGALIVPRSALLESLHVTAFTRPRNWTDEELIGLSRRFRVSREVIVRRLVFVGGATKEFYLKKRKEYSEQAQQPREGYASPSVKAFWRVGGEFARLVLDAYDRHAISTGEVADLLGVRVKHFDRIRELAFGIKVIGAE